MKSLFEQMGRTYRQEGDYLIPNITLLDEDNQLIGVWGQRHKRYLKQKKSSRGITEQLKDKNFLEWVRRFNNI